MAKRVEDHSGVLPWPTDWVGQTTSEQISNHRQHGPRNLEVFWPEQWDSKAGWHDARSSVARSLGRRCLPEIQAMTDQGPLASYTGGEGR